MELEDCAFPLLRSVVTTSNADEAFRGANWALLVGAVPARRAWSARTCSASTPGSSRGRARSIAANAAEDVRVLVVGNPCNTNCLIASQAAPDIPRDRWFAMTMLDETRGRALLARRAGATVAEVRDLVIWGNHSSTQFPDAYHATIGGGPRPRSSTTMRGCAASSSPPSSSAGPRSSRPAARRPRPPPPTR